MARALILDPAILLLDEPVSALDAVSRSQMLDLMRRLADEHGIAQIFISHDLDSIAGVADRVAVLHQGRIVEAGPADRITTSPAHAYTRRLLESAPRLHAPASRPTRQSNDFPAEYLS
jgi:peptide/nickel transport system ATP-binding protein